MLSIPNNQLVPIVVFSGVTLYLFLKMKLQGSKQHGRSSWSELERMPRELQTSTLFMNEQSISMNAPVPYHGKVDQVFKTSNGRLIIVDTKSRDSETLFTSDIYQMSVYRFILSRRYGSAVSMYGYLRISKGNYKPEITYLRVRLLGDDAMIHLWHEYNGIREGEYKPECTCGGSLHR